ncbi:MAG TPA: DUF1015 domain-containing protein [Terriglobales bacterium]|nr:DUF1015 domain-containing protein [Terriglobales bacterium]
MAIIHPFQAWRYDTTKVRLEDVVTQPYDKISPQMQDHYYSASPNNLVRIILGKSEPGDNDTTNVYSRAAADFRAWRDQGILRRDPAPSIYAYQQQFKIRGDLSGMRHIRTGFIALGKLHDYTEQVVHRHEQTLSKPKADRLNLLRATRGHFGQIFMLYRSSHDLVGSLVPPPTMSLKDEYGVEHRVWKITDPKFIARLQHDMSDKKLIIADGHHRYETALAFRDEMRAAGAATYAGAQGGSSEAPRPWEFVMMTFVNMDSPGLVVLPTHRVVKGLESFQLSELLAKAGQWFTVEEVTPRFHPDQPVDLLDGDDAPHYAYMPTILAVSSDRVHLLRAKPGNAESALPNMDPKERQLDVVQLHKLLLENALRMTEEDIRAQKHLAYIRDPREAVVAVRSGGAQLAFLINPVRIEQVRDIAFGGGVMPQKSTDFYPKLLSGLTIYALD